MDVEFRFEENFLDYFSHALYQLEMAEAKQDPVALKFTVLLIGAAIELSFILFANEIGITVRDKKGWTKSFKTIYKLVVEKVEENEDFINENGIFISRDYLFECVEELKKKRDEILHREGVVSLQEVWKLCAAAIFWIKLTLYDKIDIDRIVHSTYAIKLSSAYAGELIENTTLIDRNNYSNIPNIASFSGALNCHICGYEVLRVNEGFELACPGCFEREELKDCQRCGDWSIPSQMHRLNECGDYLCENCNDALAMK